VLTQRLFIYLVSVFSARFSLEPSECKVPTIEVILEWLYIRIEETRREFRVQGDA
jgi:hypothetical protein